jgi:hypothetical protein
MLIRQATFQDVPYIVDIFEIGRSDSKLFHWLLPFHKEHPNYSRKVHLARTKMQILHPKTHGYVAITESSDPTWTGKSEIVGYAFWIRNGNDDIMKQQLTRNTWSESKLRI